jgi:hypothetical protein
MAGCQYFHYYIFHFYMSPLLETVSLGIEVKNIFEFWNTSLWTAAQKSWQMQLFYTDYIWKQRVDDTRECSFLMAYDCAVNSP